MAEFNNRVANMIKLHLAGVAITINAVVDQGYATTEEMEQAIIAWVEGHQDPLNDLIQRAADETLEDEIEEAPPPPVKKARGKREVVDA